MRKVILIGTIFILLVTLLTGTYAYHHKFSTQLKAEGSKNVLLTVKLTAQANDLAELYSQISDKNSQIDSLLGSTDELESLSAELKAKTEALETEKEQLSAGLKNKKTEINALWDQIEGLTKSLEKRQQEVWTEAISAAWNQKTIDNLERENRFLADFLVELAKNQQDNALRVQPVLFVPNDITARPESLTDINRAVATAQAWYSDLVGKTFQWNQAKIMAGQHHYSWYANKQGDVHLEAIGELSDRLAPEDRPKNWIYLIFFDGWPEREALAGTYYAVSDSQRFTLRYAFFGDMVLDYLSASPNEKQIAVHFIAHELGHSLGLPHNGSEGSIMRPHYAPVGLNAIFTTEEVASLQKKPYLK